MIISRSIILLIIIWSVYLINALQTKENFIYISLNSTILIICFILAILIGSVVFNLNNYSTKYKLYPSNYKSLLVRGKIFNFCLISYCLILIIIFLRKIFYPYIFDIEILRPNIFSPIKQEPHIISVIYVFLIYTKSLLLSFLLFFLLKFFFTKKYLKIILIIVALIFESFIFNSKGILSTILFLYILFFFLSKFKKQNINFFFQSIQTVIIILLLIYIIEINRNGNLIAAIKEYLLISPSLLSSVVDNTLQVFYNKWSFDNIFVIFSGLDYLVTIILRAFGIPMQTYGYEIIKFLDIAQVADGDVLHYNFHLRNSFYTILLEPYLSFGFFGVILLGFAAGYIISKNEYTYAKYNCEYSLFFLQFFSGVVGYGIFGSGLSTVTFWLVLGFMIFFKSYIFIKNPTS
jgi:oligosaccharide repeat unit polymerase